MLPPALAPAGGAPASGRSSPDAQIVPEPSEEVYAAVAYMLNLNGIIDEDHVIDAKSLLT